MVPFFLKKSLVVLEGHCSFESFENWVLATFVFMDGIKMIRQKVQVFDILQSLHLTNCACVIMTSELYMNPC